MTGTLRVPLNRPKPDIEAFCRAITTDAERDRPPLVEFIVDRTVMEPVLHQLGRPWAEADAASEAYWDNVIAFWYHMGYDFVHLEVPAGLTRHMRPGGVRGREFLETGRGPIASWDDYEAYPWPNPEEADFFPYEHIQAHLPEGMGLIANYSGGPFEQLTYLMGYETLCVSLFEQPDLVAAVVKRIGEQMERYYRRLLQLPSLVALFPGDDMGFRTATLISPNDLRKYTLGWHKRFAEMAHQAGRLYLLHTCGQTEAIMDDLIDDVGIDAKHSFEDAICPIPEAKKRWGGRVGLLGGVDIDALTRLDPDALRVYVRKTIDACAPGGRFAIGSGNSIPDYIPVENYLTMIDEALR